MNKETAKREACRRVRKMIEHYREVGQPEADHGCDDPSKCSTCRTLISAFDDLIAEMARRGGKTR